MKLFKLFFTLLGGLCLLAQISFAETQYDSVAVQNLNDSASIEFMAESLMDLFPSQEDKRVISFELLKLKKVSKKWDWRYEVQGDALAFRVNGKVQATFKPDPQEANSFFMNGTKIQLTKGMSFRSFLTKVQKAMNSKVVKIEDLFIHKADAIWPFLLGGAIGTAIGYRWCAKPAHGKAKSRRCRGRNCNKAAARQGRRVRKGSRRNCQLNAQGLKFNINQMSETAVRRKHICNPSRNHGFNINGCFDGVQACVYWKGLRPRNRYYKSLNEMDKLAICNEVERYYQCRIGGTPAPQQVYNPAPNQNDGGSSGFEDIVGPTCPKGQTCEKSDVDTVY